MNHLSLACILFHLALLALSHPGASAAQSSLEFMRSDQALSGPSVSREVALGDLDGDGDQDAWVVHYSTTTAVDRAYSVWENNGSGFFTETSQAFGSVRGSSVSLGDFNSDGHLDAFVIQINIDNQDEEQSEYQYLFLNDGDGSLNDGIGFTRKAIEASLNLPVAQAVGDLNGDGHLDVWFLAREDQIVLLGDGLGSLEEASLDLSAPLPGTVGGVQLADMNGDGALDAVVHKRDGFGIWLNNLQSNLEPEPGFIFLDTLQPADWIDSLAVCDLDGDAFPDVFVVARYKDEHLYFNDGGGTLLKADPVARGLDLASAERSIDVECGDLDDDGDFDLWVPNYSPGRKNGNNVIFLNRGDGNFDRAPLEDSVFDATYAIAGELGDLNGDGRLDAWVSANNQQVSGGDRSDVIFFQQDPAPPPVNACDSGNGGCHPLTACTDNPGSEPTCGACPPGYSGNGYTGCTEVDECLAGIDDCAITATCTNTPGSFSCSCDAGYAGDGRSCTNVDECSSASGNDCDLNATCTDTAGSYSCACNDGYEGDGTSCAEIVICTGDRTYAEAVAEGCTEIDGNLFVCATDVFEYGPDGPEPFLVCPASFSEDLENLAGLGSLQAVSGYVRIHGNPGLKSLAGLDSLNSVSGQLKIDENPELLSLSGLGALEHVGGFFGIYFNNKLTSVEALGNLRTIGGGLSLLNNRLNSLAGLEGLESIVSLGVMMEDRLESLEGLNPAVTIEQWIFIRGNDALASLPALTSATHLEGGFQVGFNPRLTSLAGFDAIESAASILIDHNVSLTDLDGLGSLAEVGEITIEENSALCQSVIDQFLSGIATVGTAAVDSGNKNDCVICAGEHDYSKAVDAGCTEIDGNLVIEGTALVDLVGLGSLESVSGDVKISGDNPALATLAGLDSLISVGGTLEISSNAVLESLEAASSLITIGQNVWIKNNPTLCQSSVESFVAPLNVAGSIGLTPGNRDVCEASEEVPCDGDYDYDQAAAEGCTTIDGDLTIDGSGSARRASASPVNLDGLRWLRSISGNLVIRNNPDLRNLSGLQSLSTVGGSLQIENNPRLQDLGGLGSLYEVQGGLVVDGNPELNDASGLSALGIAPSEVTITNNAALCGEWVDPVAGLIPAAMEITIEGNTGTCDGCPPAPLRSCAENWSKGLLLVKENAAGKEKLIAKFLKGPALMPFDFGDPAGGDTSYAGCLYHGGGGFVEALEIDRGSASCGAKPCFKRLGARGYLYKDAEASADGIEMLKLLSGPEGKSALLLKARNNAKKGQTAMPTSLTAALAGTSGATLQLHSSDGWTACYGLTLQKVKKDTGNFFKAVK